VSTSRLRILKDAAGVPQGAPDATLVVHEIYASLQGESSWAGLPCGFVRLSACHLRCTWCDTPHAFDEGARRTVEDVVARRTAWARTWSRSRAASRCSSPACIR
jgi:hypothetical protein